MKTPKFWIGAFSVVGVIAISLQYVGRTSPGPVTATHAAIAELDNGQNCAACHGGWLASMTESCLTCHEAITEDIEAGKGIHGRVDQLLAGQCVSCHSEHHGAGFEIVNRSSFAIAGVVGPEDFDHKFVGFAMAGEHLELTCAECHEHAEAPSLGEGQHRYLGLDQSCATCHTDAHEGRMTATCVSCHGQESFDVLHATGHDRFLALTGGHADVSCRTCHAADTEHALEMVGSRRDRGLASRSDRACADCHASPHSELFVERIAAAAGLEPSASCAECHRDDHLDFLDEALTVTPEQHAQSGFSLTEPHQDAACADCHGTESSSGEYATRYPGRDPLDCRSCHEDPHGGQFAGGTFAMNVLGSAASAGQDVACTTCHERTHFEPPVFGPEQHAQTDFPLSGQHERADCVACHLDPEAGSPREFRGTPLRCDECHSDAHAGFFAARPSAPLGEVEPTKFGTCATCHEAGDSFGDLVAPFDHAHWTGFPIRGAHAQAECTSCHPRAAAPDDTGRTFGRVEEHFGALDGCVTCHQDPHRGSFDLAGMPTAVEGRVGCARCHDEASFRQLVADFDHQLWTGFGLLGKHGKTECASCHTPLRRPDAEGRTWARAKGSACADCHSDPHAGQFAKPGGQTACVDCHKFYSVFDDLAFDHDRQSRFRLGEAHADVACSACHKPEQLGDELVVRYRPLPTQCVECHGSAEDPLRRRARRR